MRVEPRRQVLDILDPMLRVSNVGSGKQRKWVWGSGEHPNSLQDAEQLLVLLHPVNEMNTFALHDVGERISDADDLYGVLQPVFRSMSGVPSAVVDICQGYFDRHVDANGEPSFTGGSYLTPFHADGSEVTDKQRESIEVVDSFSMSLTLCLAVLAFILKRRGEKGVSSEEPRLAVLEKAASRRLTAAMIGLVRSFVVNAVYSDDEVGKNILDNLGGGRIEHADLIPEFHSRMTSTRARLRTNVNLGIPQASLPDDKQLFEIGWSWGVDAQAEPVPDMEGFDIAVSPGIADSRPYLYFTVVALDGIVDLFSARVRDMAIFDEVQTRLVDALRIRWELTQRYWSHLARFTPEQWPLQDLPWRTSDGEASDYYSLLVTSVLIKDFDERKPAASDLDKAVAILGDLADRAKITKRMVPDDAAMVLHSPGVRLRLMGTETEGPLLVWHSSDFTPMLLKRAFQAFRLTTDVDTRLELTRLAEAAMEHIDARLIKNGDAAGLWDDTTRLMPPRPGEQRPAPPDDPAPSWNYTERVIEGLVTAAYAYQEVSPRSEAEYRALMAAYAEADHQYNQKLLTTDVDDRSQQFKTLAAVDLNLRRARSMLRTKTSTAAAWVTDALKLLDGLAQAEADADADSKRGG